MIRVQAIICVSAIAALAYWGAEVPAATWPEPPRELAHTELVRKLGSPSYAVREAAARELAASGLAARPALLEGLKDTDLEVRMGAHRLLVRVLQEDFDRRMERFLNREHDPKQGDFPGWTHFQTQVGDTDLARRLYVEMLRAEYDLLEALERGSEELPRLLAERIEHSSNSGLQLGPHRTPVSEATLATMLFVGGYLDGGSPAGDQRVGQSMYVIRLYSLLSGTNTQQVISQSGYAPVLNNLLTSSIEALAGQANGQYAGYALQLTLKYDMHEPGIRLARTALQQNPSQAGAKPYAAIVLGRFGQRDDAAFLAPHLKDANVFHTWGNPQLKPEPIQIQVRDVMLAMTARLQGYDPKELGFQLLDPFPETVYRIWTFGFLEDADREAAFAKWEELNRPGQ